MNIWLTILIILFVIALVIFIIKKNQKDKNDLEEYIKHDFPGATHKSSDVDTEENPH